jgi:hypothetical protein
VIARVQWFEIEDQPWCPGWLRDAMTDYLAEVSRRAAPYAPAAELLRPRLQALGVREVFDLCSGAGGPWLGLQPALAAGGERVRVTCSDAHPNPRAARQLERASNGAIRYRLQPHRVTDPLPETAGFRTMFSALHHFAPPEATAILRDARDAGAGIAAFEATQRSPRGLLAMALVPLVVLAITPLIRPVRWWRLAFTYLLPVIPFAVWWDGTVSSLRTYSVGELQGFADALARPGYRWTVGEVRAAGAVVPMTYIIGEPQPPRDSAGSGPV